MENKNGYFILKIGIPENKFENEPLKEEIKNSVDLILASMGVQENSEENFIKDDNSRLIYIFKTKERKGQWQTKKKCRRNYGKKTVRVIFSQLEKLPVITVKLILKTYKMTQKVIQLGIYGAIV